MRFKDQGDPTTIHHGWESYAADVLPKDAHSNQIIETRRAFYAGAWCLMQTLILLGDSGASEGAFCSVMERITEEIEAFQRSVGKGGL
jgi:hypothetical protein